MAARGIGLLDLQNGNGETALIRCARDDACAPCLEVLARHGASLDLANNTGDTALCVAAKVRCGLPLPTPPHPPPPHTSPAKTPSSRPS